MRKLIAGISSISLMMLLVLNPLSAFGQSENIFDDVAADSKNAKAISYLKDKNIVKGYQDDTYRPEQTINRAEFVKIAALMMTDGKDEEIDSCIDALGDKKWFTDVDKEQWYASYVCFGMNKGLVKGYEDGSFKPGQDISFAEGSKIILKVFGIEVGEDGEMWFSNYGMEMGELKAIPTDMQSVHSKITRGQMAEMIWRIAEKPSDITYQNYAKLIGEEAETATENAGAFPLIASCEDLSQRISSAGWYGDDVMEETAAPLNSSSGDGSSGDSASSLGGTTTESKVQSSNDDFSSTNIQVQGVDEADIVKNDGQYIYMVRKDTVRIVKAAPIANMVELSKLTFSDENFYPSELYLSADTLVVLGSTWYQPTRSDVESSDDETADIMSTSPAYYGQSRTKAYVIDIKDRTEPKKLREVSVDGNLSSSRRVGEYVYLVMNKYPNFYYGEPVTIQEDLLVPGISDVKSDANSTTVTSEPMVGCGDIHYFPGYQQPNYLIVAGLPIGDVDKPVEREVILGASENIYSSAKNLYVASTDYNYGIQPVPLVIDSSNPVEDPATDGQEDEEEGEKTVVYKFGLDEGKVEFKTTGSAPGRILNQFSMDEDGEYFRIATTKGNSWDDRTLSTNNVYVLDKDLEIVGELEDIAPGESIFSTRFMGKRLYMVTFKKVDPLFVIDLADPSNPKILGKLKIPGFSDYLHPYDENHIIGFGKDAVEATEEETQGRSQFAWYQGMKMAIFDVSNVEEPKEKFVTIIGDRGTSSELLYNHKALLFDKEKNLLAFPIKVAELTEEQKAENTGSAYGEIVFDGAYVYDINLVNGFDLRGTITHHDGDDVFKKSGDYYYGSEGLSIKRVIYIGDYLYSISNDVIKGLTMDTVQEKNRVDLADK